MRMMLSPSFTGITTVTPFIVLNVVKMNLEDGEGNAQNTKADLSPVLKKF